MNVPNSQVGPGPCRDRDRLWAESCQRDKIDVPSTAHDSAAPAQGAEKSLLPCAASTLPAQLAVAVPLVVPRAAADVTGTALCRVLGTAISSEAQTTVEQWGFQRTEGVGGALGASEFPLRMQRGGPFRLRPACRRDGGLIPSSPPVGY